MHRLALAVIAAVAIAGAATLGTPRAEAMTLPGITHAPASQAQDVALVCRRVWNGYRWVRSCYRTGPRYYYAPRPYYRPHYRPYRPHYYRHRFY